MELMSQEGINSRYLNANDIYVPPGYKIELYLQGLEAPTCIKFNDMGDLLIAESGYHTGNPRILRLRKEEWDVVADGFQVPIMGLDCKNELLYVSHIGKISRVNQDGSKQDIISGLPGTGDYHNNNVTIGPDNRIYFGQGTATNSGVVGSDNTWIKEHPFGHDYPGDYIMVNGQNFNTPNEMTGGKDIAYTGAFSPYGVPNVPFEVKKGKVKATGSILRMNLDGTDLEMYAWGLRNPARIKFNEEGRLFVSNHGYDVRGSRPIANAPDCFEEVFHRMWYGWPDYSGGEPVTSSRLRPEGGPQPEFLLTNHPNKPPIPFAVFPPNSNIMGFDFCYSSSFGSCGDVYITELGDIGFYTEGRPMSRSGGGHRVTRIDMGTGGITTFAINRSGFPNFLSGEGGFGRPIDLTFGPDGALYVLDYGSNLIENPEIYVPNSGVVWRIIKLSDAEE